MEGAIYAIREIFQDKCDDGFDLLLMDAANAFNSISSLLLYGMLEYFGLDVQDSFLTLTEVMHC